MAFNLFFPLFDRNPQDLSTSANYETQIWQQFIMLRHAKKIPDRKNFQNTSPWIDQAKIYFEDACNSNWRSSGLLYYYSLLNLSKAYLVASSKISKKKIRSTSIYHGLSMLPQSPGPLPDFQIEIHSSSTTTINIFDNLYEAITGSKWPFKAKIQIPLSSVISYCMEIGSEIQEIYNIPHAIAHAQSLIRYSNNTVWYEILILEKFSDQIISHAKPWLLTKTDPSLINELDRNDWLLALDRTAATLQNHSFIRSEITPYTGQDELKKILDSLFAQAKDGIYPYAVAASRLNTPQPYWLFTPKIDIFGKEILWHPLLSDYLIAFSLSHILRYQPHLIELNSKNSFIAEAWCNQSALTALRYFLMLSTNPPIRLGS